MLNVHNRKEIKMKVIEILEDIKIGYYVEFGEEKFKILIDQIYEDDGETYVDGYSPYPGGVRQAEYEITDDMIYHIISKY